MRLPWRRLLSLLSAVLIALGANSLSASAEEYSGFDDVSETAWYGPAVRYVTEQQLFRGTGDRCFSPEASMTRGMFVTVLGRLAGVDPTRYPVSYFRDVPSGAYYSPYVQWAASFEIVNGVGDDHFAPNAAVTREEIAAILYRFAGATGNDDTVLPGFLDFFTDGDQLHSWAKAPMEWAVSHGILAGYQGRLTPRNDSTRAQVAQIFLNSAPVLTSTAILREPISLTPLFSPLEEKLEELRQQFPAGKYWNHAGLSVPEKDQWSVVTDRPCDHPAWRYDCNHYDGVTAKFILSEYEFGMQCLGFASMISDRLFGEDAPIRSFRNFDQLRVGDHIRIPDPGHSMIVIRKKPDAVLVAEVNREDVTSLIEWGRQVTRQELDALGANVLYTTRYPD